jgi:glycosyltransferase involved in cell wall biosynthesis
MDFAFNGPIGPVSFGQTSVAILREFYKAGLEPCIFPIGNHVDLSTQVLDQGFNSWIQKCVSKSLSHHKRTNPIIKLWHLNGGLESYSNEQVLLTFYETDSPTKEEVNAVKNNKHVVFTSQYSASIFSDYGIDNCRVIPLGFDSHNFHVIDKKPYDDGRITFLCLGKFEQKRKKQDRIIRAWMNKFGNNPKYALHCAIYNTFLSPEENSAIVNQIAGGQKNQNVTFYNWAGSNSDYNKILNSADIVIGMGTEGFGLGEFHATALGKHAVILNCAGYKTWADKENAVLVSPKSKHPCYDGKFFFEGHPFNQGNFYDYDDEEFIAACEIAVRRFETSSVNIEGLKLQQNFTYKKTADQLLALL